MKKIIRLTESELHNMVSEGIKQVLSELDWKTYMNAADKQKKAGDYSKYNRSQDFKKAAERNFNDQFGYEDEDSYYKMRVDGEPMNTYPYKPKDVHTQARVRRDKNTNAYDDVINYDYDEPSYENGYNGEPSGYYNLNHKDIDNYYDKLDDLSPIAKRGNDEISDYRNGNYVYQKGKGWVKR